MTTSGSCHCGATRFELDFAPKSVTNCNCTFCSKRGALWAYYTPDQVRFTALEQRATYSRSGFNKHHFCTVCGCTTYSETPTWTLEGGPDLEHPRISINARLLDDIDIDAIEMERIDGRHLWLGRLPRPRQGGLCSCEPLAYAS